MNERLFRVANGFYSALNDYHFYTPAILATWVAWERTGTGCDWPDA